MHHLVSSREVFHTKRNTKRLGHLSSKFLDSVWRVRADVENLIYSAWDGGRRGDQRSYIINIGEGSSLLAIAKNTHRLTVHRLIHENPNHVAILVRDVLAFAVYVMWAKNSVIKPEHLLCS